MNSLIFIWVLFIPAGNTAYFETQKACQDFRSDLVSTYKGFAAMQCHKQILIPSTDFLVRP